MRQLREKRAKLKAHATAKSKQVQPEVISDDLHDRLSEKSLTVAPCVNHHKLTQVADKYCSYYD